MQTVADRGDKHRKVDEYRFVFLDILRDQA